MERGGANGACLLLFLLSTPPHPPSRATTPHVEPPLVTQREFCTRAPFLDGIDLKKDEGVDEPTHFRQTISPSLLVHSLQDLPRNIVLSLPPPPPQRRFWGGRGGAKNHNIFGQAL